MDETQFEARDYLNHLRSQGEILQFARYDGNEPSGRGWGLILNRDDRIAVMLTDCGDPKNDTDIWAGDLVNYVLHPEAEPKIVGSPASMRP